MRGKIEAEERLIPAMVNYPDILDSLLEGCQIINSDWRCLYVNDAAARHGRRNKTELLGHTMMEVYPGIEDTEMFARLRLCMAKRVPQRLENLFTFPDGAHGWFELSVEPVPEGIFILSLDITERKQAEEALSKSETRYRSLVEGASAGVAVLDLKGRLLYFNSALCRMLGYSEEEMLGKPFADFIHPDDREKTMPRLQQVLTQPEAKLDLEFRAIHKDGRVVHMYSCPTVLVYGGKVAGFSAIIADITERKRLEEHNAYLASFAELNPNPVLEFDREGNPRYENPAAGRIFPDLATGAAEHPLVADWAQVVAELEGSQWRRAIVREVAVNGSFYEELISPIAENQIRVYCRDITERRQAEEFLKTVSENSPIGMYMVQDGKFLYVNSVFQKSMGYTRDELLSTEPLSYVFPGDRDVVRASAIMMLKEKLPYPYEYRIINKSGHIRWIMETVASIQYRGKRATLGNFMDITERKLLEKKMIEYEELNKLKTDLLSMVSHELRTPLATIKGYATMILDYYQKLSDEEKQEHLQSIDRATDRLTELVDRLLDMSRLDAGLLKLDRAPTSMLRLIKEAVAEAQLRATQHNIVMRVNGAELPQAMVDARRIREVLDNLLDNACKYSEEKTEIAVSVRCIGRQLLVCVADQGVGIPAKELERVFDRMYRIEQKPTPGKKAGLGLGLAICRGLVEAHGGRIWMASEEGKGSKCSFTLPL